MYCFFVVVFLKKKAKPIQSQTALKAMCVLIQCDSIEVSVALEYPKKKNEIDEQAKGDGGKDELPEMAFRVGYYLFFLQYRC